MSTLNTCVYAISRSDLIDLHIAAITTVIYGQGEEYYLRNPKGVLGDSPAVEGALVHLPLCVFLHMQHGSFITNHLLHNILRPGKVWNALNAQLDVV
jgi:hypothetical protein